MPLLFQTSARQPAGAARVISDLLELHLLKRIRSSFDLFTLISIKQHGL